MSPNSDYTELTCGQTVTGSTVGLPQVSCETCDSVGDGSGTGGAKWYFFTANGADEFSVTISTCDELTNFDTKIRVYRLDHHSAERICEAGNDDDSTCGTASSVSFDHWEELYLYSQYAILVHGQNGQEGDFSLHLRCTPILYRRLTDKDEASDFNGEEHSKNLFEPEDQTKNSLPFSCDEVRKFIAQYINTAFVQNAVNHFTSDFGPIKAELLGNRGGQCQVRIHFPPTYSDLPVGQVVAGFKKELFTIISDPDILEKLKTKHPRVFDWVTSILPSGNQVVDGQIKEEQGKKGKQQVNAKKSKNAKAKMSKKIKNKTRGDKSSKSV